MFRNVITSTNSASDRYVPSLIGAFTQITRYGNRQTTARVGRRAQKEPRFLFFFSCETVLGMSKLPYSGTAERAADIAGALQRPCLDAVGLGALDVVLAEELGLACQHPVEPDRRLGRPVHLEVAQCHVSVEQRVPGAVNGSPSGYKHQSARA